MWLDRFSGHSTPSGSPPQSQNRSSSPAPRRSSQFPSGPIARPGFSPRSSSLSVAQNGTHPPRLPNGSALKQQITPPADFTDPSDVLEKIIGRPLSGKLNGNGTTDENRLAEKPSQLFHEIAFDGLSLHEFAEVGAPRGEDVEVINQALNIQTAEEYEAEKAKFEDLHQSILSVEVSLTSFQKDLGAVSAEIETLQSRSTALNTRLENRRVVEKLLGPAVEEVSIAPAVVKKISEGPIDQTWVKALDELEKRSKVIENKLKSPGTMQAVRDIKPLLDDLINKALERIRDFFVSQIKAMRSPNMNAQILQQQTFLKYKDLYVFLATHHPQLAEEIGQAYINTMRWYYLSHFARYRQAVEKISLYNIDKHDMLGADPTSQRSNMNPAAKAAQISHDAINLGRRMDVLKRSPQTAISSYLAEEDKSTHYLETPFLSFNLALIDNASAEYSFLTQFFSPNTFHQVSLKFASIFDPTFALGHALTKSLIDPTYDCLGILLCVRLNQHFAFELQRRKVPAADGYINGTNMLLWPRFQLAMDAHCESVRRATAAVSTRSAALSLTGSSSGQSTAPHLLTQRFGQFLQGILALSSEGGDEEPVASSLGRLRGEFEGFLGKVAKSLGGEGRRERFLGNNYALVLTIVGDSEGRLAREQREHFEGLRGVA